MFLNFLVKIRFMENFCVSYQQNARIFYFSRKYNDMRNTLPQAGN